MADISTEIAAIGSAVYGKDVRGAIVDALEAMNGQAEAAEAWATGGESSDPASSTNNAKYYSEQAAAQAEAAEASAAGTWKLTHINSYLGSDAEYDDMKTPGVYRCASDATAAAIGHSPTTRQHRLIVSKGSSNAAYFQAVIDAAGRFFLRYYLGTWTAWSEMAQNAGIEALEAVIAQQVTPYHGADLAKTLTPVNGVTVDGVFSASSNWREFTIPYDPACYYVFPWVHRFNFYYADGTFRKSIAVDKTISPYVINGLSLGVAGEGDPGPIVKAAVAAADLADFYIYEIPKHPRSNWKGKTCKIFGDSVMAGNWASVEGTMQKVKNPFGEAACAELGIQVLSNDAVGGACFGPHDGYGYIYDQVDALASNACNLVLLRGGGNDFTRGTPIGDLEAMTTDSGTLYSEMYKVVSKIQSACKGATIVMITMLHRGVKLTNPTSYVYDFLDTATNSLGLKLRDYRDAIVNFCVAMGIPCCDMFSDAMLNPMVLGHAATVNAVSEIPAKIYNANPVPWFYQDRQHPLERAHERMAHLLVQTIEGALTTEAVYPSFI